MNNYKNLKLWQGSVDLAVAIYDVTQKFLKEEQYGLTSQLRRSAVSIPSNLAEGAGRNTTKDFNNFLEFHMAEFRIKKFLINKFYWVMVSRLWTQD